MNDVMQRLGAADPSPVGQPPTDAEIATVVRRSTTSAAGAPPPRIHVRAKYAALAGVAAAAMGIAAVQVVDVVQTNRHNTETAPLRVVAHQVAAGANAAAPGGRDVLYAKWNLVEIFGTMLSSKPRPSEYTVDDVIRVRWTNTVENWHPLGSRERPYARETATGSYLTQGDADRAARLTPADRRQLNLPPEGSLEGIGELCPRLTCSTVPEGDPEGPGTVLNPTPEFVRTLPADPARLESLIQNDPHVGDGDRAYGAVLMGLLEYVPTPQPVRAAAIQLLADVPSIVVYGDRAVGGRTGIAIGYENQPESDATVIDRRTGIVITDRMTLTEDFKAGDGTWQDTPVGTVISSRTLVQLDYVSQVPNH